VRYRVLACDYDGTIARDGVVSEGTLAALRRVKASGRHLVLVTGRELDHLLAVFPEADVFDWIVAENGALLYRPTTREEHALGPPPPAALVSRLEERHVRPLSVGKVILATWQPNEGIVLETIRDLGLELNVIFNKGAVMVMPSGLNKRVGLEDALARLGLSSHNCVGVGDAENDHAFLAVSECSVAVSNALPAIREAVDWVTEGSHGAGVEELIDRLVDDDLHRLEPRLGRHDIALGAFDDGEELKIHPYGEVVLTAGRSGGGKSTAASALLERLMDRGYQVCVIDPEGDHDGLEAVVTVGTPDRAPEFQQVVQVLARPDNHVVVNLLGVAMPDRPHFLRKLLGHLHELRAATGRPHWIVIDEAHHVLEEGFDPALIGPPHEFGSMLLITVRPERIHRALLERVGVVLAVGPESVAVLRSFAVAAGRVPPEVRDVPEQVGQVLVWDGRASAARRATTEVPRRALRRHRRKYARGELGPDKSFYFRGPEDRLNLRARNLVLFNQIAEGIDDETWLFHLANADYSRWVREAIKDDELAAEVERIEAQPGLSASESRQMIREAIERKYTLPP